MSQTPSPSLKSHTPPPTGPRAAERPAQQRTVGDPKVVAEGVPSGSAPHPTTGPRILALLRISTPGRGATPSVRSWCTCGRDLTAFGQRRAAALIEGHDRHRTVCPLLTEGKEAA
ncbi:hypothetical protein [Streptomyces sp. CC210A]|uniref:hypothetical protein n=1 Tax=Streptomyces sp. CC210A TaxID=2898184 RepID=UPI001F29CE55|nr:hypothetical protein [Streptomyces sp. CC210A]